MKKQLIKTSLLFLFATAALWVGCSHNWSRGSVGRSLPAWLLTNPHPMRIKAMRTKAVLCKAMRTKAVLCKATRTTAVPCKAMRTMAVPCKAPEDHGGPMFADAGAPAFGNGARYADGRAPVGGSCRPKCPPPACRPVCPPPACGPVCTPPACKPACPTCKPLPRCHYPSSNELCCRDGIIVSARNPSMCMLGDQYPLEFDVKACDDVCDVVVTTHLPEGVSYVRSQPEAKVEGRAHVELRPHEKRRMPSS